MPPGAVEAGLQTGLKVNWVFIVVTALFMAGVTYAAGRKTTARRRGIAELKLAFYNSGFAAYISAGSAFFGALSFSRAALRNHTEFTLIWSFGLLFLVAVQLLQSRLDADSPMVKSRVTAVLLGVYFSWWAWDGARDTFLQ